MEPSEKRSSDERRLKVKAAPSARSEFETSSDSLIDRGSWKCQRFPLLTGNVGLSHALEYNCR